MVEITLASKAFSVNAYYYRDHRFKTAQAREWEAQIMDLLQEHKCLLELAEEFKEKGGVFHVYIAVVYPHHIFYNKSKQVSAKTFDVTNTEKPIIDLIFKQFMGVDDRHIVYLRSAKVEGATHRIDVAIELFPVEL